MKNVRLHYDFSIPKNVIHDTFDGQNPVPRMCKIPGNYIDYTYERYDFDGFRSSSKPPATLARFRTPPEPIEPQVKMTSNMEFFIETCASFMCLFHHVIVDA